MRGNLKPEGRSLTDREPGPSQGTGEPSGKVQGRWGHLMVFRAGEERNTLTPHEIIVTLLFNIHDFYFYNEQVPNVTM